MASSAPLRIGFDARLAGPSHTGIGRYGAELLTRFLAQKELKNRAVTWVVFVSRDADLSWFTYDSQTSIEIIKVAIPHYGWKEQLVWPLLLRKAELDLLYIPHFNVPLLYFGRYVMTLHDLLWHTQRDLRATTLSPVSYFVKRYAYMLVSEWAVRRAQAVIVPTQVVARDIARFIGRKKDVFVLSEGIPELYRSAKLLKTKKPEKYCVYMGNLYPHKNFSVLLEALQLDPSMRLKVVGARSVFLTQAKKKANELGVEKQLEWLGFVADEEVIALYQNAVALVQPSLSEGFGLPGLEALSVGCPIIVSDIPVFREVYQDQAKYFLASSAEEIVKHWHSLTEKPPTSSQKEKFRIYALQFDWKQVSEKALRIFASLLV